LSYFVIQGSQLVERRWTRSLSLDMWTGSHLLIGNLNGMVDHWNTWKKIYFIVS